MNRLIACILTLLPTAVLAQGAELHYQEAVRLFGEGRYLESRNAFEQAIQLDPQSVFFCNKALVELRLQETSQATRSMRECRERFEGDPQELAIIDAQLQGLELVEHIRPQSLIITRDIAAGPIAPVRQSSWDSADTGFVLLGVSAALLGSALTLDLLSKDLRDDFALQSKGGPGTSETQWQSMKDDLQTRQTLFYTVGISGAALALVGTGFIIHHYTRSTPQISFYAAPGELGIKGYFK